MFYTLLVVNWRRFFVYLLASLHDPLSSNVDLSDIAVIAWNYTHHNITKSTTSHHAEHMQSAGLVCVHETA